MSKEQIAFAFPDGSSKKYEKGVTGELIAKGIGEGLARAALGVKLDSEVLDLNCPLSTGGALFLITAKMPKEANLLLWHSTSHILAEAVLKLFPKAKPAVGPAIEDGFYYDFDVEKPFTPADLEKIEVEMKKILSKKISFERKEISRADALKLFAKNAYKKELIEELPKDAKISTYKSGSFEDLCAGPHLPNSSFIKAFKLLRCSGAYWRGSEKNKMLQRIYGIAFFEEKG
ncbi:MAG: TGS domain-containing protein, partial [Candidatus Diapherotrites archaeon]